MKTHKINFYVRIFLVVVLALFLSFSLAVLIAYKNSNFDFLVTKNKIITKIDNFGLRIVSAENYKNKTELLALLINNYPILKDYPPLNLHEDYHEIKSKIYVSQFDLDSAEHNADDWLMVNGNYRQNRFYPGSQLNTENVKKLKLAFTANTDIYASIQSAPLVVNGVMYVSTSYNHIYAFDAKNGNIFWHFKYKNKKPKSCCGQTNRGLAIFGDKIYMATIDGKMLAISAQSGKLKWSSNISSNSDQNPITAAPVVYDGKVYIGASSNGKRGFVTSFDSQSGKKLWTFYTIPDEGQEGVWANKDAVGRDLSRDIAKEKISLQSDNLNLKDIGGGVWNTPSIDIKSGKLFFLVGDPQPMFDGISRPGDNLYTNSLVCLDALTGRFIWHFQFIPHDILDLDFATNSIITEARDENGKFIQAVVSAGKIGYAFVNSIEKGSLIRHSKPFLPQNFSNNSDKNILNSTPNPISGVSWSPMALNPSNGSLFALVSRFTDLEKSGSLVSIDINTGKIRYEFFADHPLVGGVLATKGNLIFFGDGKGNIRSLNALSGKELWSFKCDAGANSVPISYSISGKQYIAIGCGGNSMYNYNRGNKVYVFSL